MNSKSKAHTGAIYVIATVIAAVSNSVSAQARLKQLDLTCVQDQISACVAYVTTSRWIEPEKSCPSDYSTDNSVWNGLTETLVPPSGKDAKKTKLCIMNSSHQLLIYPYCEAKARSVRSCLK